MRRLLTFVVVASWVTMVILLVRKQAPPPAVSGMPPPVVAEAGDRDEWFTVARDGKRVGHAHRVTTATGTGETFYEDSVLTLAMLGTPQTIRTSLVAETDAHWALRRFRFTLVSPATVFGAAGESDGQRLTVTYGPEGRTQRLVVPLSEPIELPSTLRPRVLAGDLTPGTRYTAPVFNPMTLRNEPLTVTVGARETFPGPDGPVDAIHLTEEHQGIRAQVWLTGAGAVLREEGSLGFTLERATREDALADTAETPVDLAVASRIPVSGRIDDPRHAERLALRIRGDAAASVPDFPPRQRRDGDVLRIEREPAPAPTPIGASTTDAEYLAPGPLIESDDATIVATAREIVGDEKDATAAARRLLAWVNEHVEQVPTASVPSAREVLATRRGDCNEHAVLLVALARAAGIPARVVAGAMFVDDGFYYHAWTELWLGRWVSADSIFRQMPVDATHVKLVEGGPERHLALAEIVGRVAFAVEEGER